MAIAGRILGRSAASDTTVEIAGLIELMKGLDALPEKVQRGPVLAALGAAGRVVRNRAVELAPEAKTTSYAVRRGRVKPGTIKRAIRHSRSKINRGQGGLWEVIVRVKRLSKRQIADFKASTGKKGALNPDDPFYWWWHEFGTSKMPKHSFLRPAFNETHDAQLRAIRTKMWKAIEKEAAKIAGSVNSASRGKARRA